MSIDEVLAELRQRIAGETDTSELVVQGVDLRGWSFVKAALRGVNFIDCDLSACDLSGAQIGGGHHVMSRFFGSILVGAVLSKANFNEADLSHARMTDATALRTSFVEAKLMGVAANRVNFTRANLMNADLRRASLRDTIFDRTSLDGARVFCADLRGARQIETAFADTLDVGDQVSEILEGDAAKRWLLDASRV